MIRRLSILLIHGMVLKTSIAIINPSEQMSVQTMALEQSYDSNNELRKCPKNSEFIQIGDSMKCTCKSKFTATPDGQLCVRVVDSVCSSSECDTSLTNLFCINSYCKCDPSDIYNPLTKKCEGRVGAICYKGIKDCAINSECVNPHKQLLHESNNIEKPKMMSFNSAMVNSDIEISGRCECQQGYVESDHQLCKKAMGMTCSSENDCDELNLVCKEGKCACPDTLQIYNFQSQSCVALAGASCSDYNLGGTMCIDNAFCKRLNLKRGGRCQCLPHSMEMPDRTCGRVSMWTPV